MNNLQLYLGEKHEKLMKLTLVSKQVYDDCKRPGAVEWKIIPTMIEPNSDQLMGGWWIDTNAQYCSNCVTISIGQRYKQEVTTLSVLT